MIPIAFIGCGKESQIIKRQDTNVEISEPVNLDKLNLSELQLKNIERFNNYNIIGRVSEYEFLVYSNNNNNSISVYDAKNDYIKEIEKPKLSGNNFFEASYDAGWLVWSENKDSAIGPENSRGFNWIVVAKNLSTGEEKIIDKAQYTEDNFDVPANYYYCPSYLSTKDGYVVYRSPDKRAVDGKIVDKIMLYNLVNSELNTLSVSEDMDKQSFLYPSTDGEKVMWLDLKDLNTSGRFRYDHNEISFYDIKNKKIEKLDLPFSNLIVSFKFNSKDVFISMEKEPTNNAYDMKDRLVKFNMKDNSVTDLLPVEDEVCASLNIDENGYVTWNNNNQYNYRMYDFKNNNIIQIGSEDEFKNYNHVSYGVDNGILRVVYDIDGNGIRKVKYYDLDKK